MSQPYPEYNESSSRPAGFGGRAAQYFVLLLFCLLVIGPLMTYGCRGERTKWSTASAMAIYNQGDKDLAIERLTEISSDFRDDPGTSALYANLLAENGRAQEGLDWCNQGLELKKDSIALIQSKANCEQYLNRPLDAFKTSKSLYSLLDSSVAASSFWKNNLAYYSSLAEVELGRSRHEMEEVVKEQAEISDWATGYRLRLVTRTYICAGVLARELDCQTEALSWLDEQIETLRMIEDDHDKALTTSVYESIQGQFPFNAAEESKITKTYRGRLNSSRDELVFLLTVRALVHQDLGNPEASQADRLWVRELGYEAEKILDNLPSVQSAFYTLNQASTYLDTYGYVLFKLESYGGARSNLDAAVLASEYNLKALDSKLHNNSEELMFDADEARPRYKRNAAILHYHRYQLYLRLQELVGDGTGLEEPDARRVRELGFDPDSRLF